MTTSIHFDKLRDRRVKGKDALVVGRNYLICHVPLDNPYTGGVNPDCHESKVIAVDLLSHNDIHTKGREYLFHDTEALARVQACDSLNEKRWMFQVEGESIFRDGSKYTHWRHCVTYVPEDGDTYNFLLDLEQLASEGVTVLRTTSETYVISDELRLEREMEDEWDRESRYDYDRDDDL